MKPSVSNRTINGFVLFSISFILIMLMTSASHAIQTDVRLNKEYFWSYLEVTGQTMTAPLRWKRTEWFTAAVFCGSTVFIYFNDTAIKNLFQNNRSGVADRVADIGNTFGNGWMMAPALIVGIGTGYLFKNNALRSASLEAFESAALSGLFVQLIKFTGQRHRPNTGDAYDTWDGPSLKARHQSFPSGHTGLAFSIAAAYAEYYNRWYVTLPAYACASLTGFARMNDNKHWASDVFFSACIGIFTAKAVHLRHSANSTTRIGLLPARNGRSFVFEWTRSI